MRFKPFTIPAAPADKIDAELVVFFFGAGQGGDTDANLARRKGDVRAPGRQEADDVAKTETIKVSGVDVTLLDIKGTGSNTSPCPWPPRKSCAPTTA